MPNRNYWFPPEIRTASIVSRWSVVWTLIHDTVANHSYFVALYAYQIARLIEWQGPLDALLMMALAHDLDETVTGDLVSPAKREILDADRAAKFVRKQMTARMNTIVQTVDRINSLPEARDIEAIIKAADRLDALLFLIVEKRLGNSVIQQRAPSALGRLQAAWYDLPAEKDNLDRLWTTVMLPAIDDHQQHGGEGI